NREQERLVITVPHNRALELSVRGGLASHPRAAARTLRERAPRRAQFASGAAAVDVEGRSASARPALQLSARSLAGQREDVPRLRRAQPGSTWSAEAVTSRARVVHPRRS